MSRLPVIVAQGGTAAPRYSEQDWQGTREIARQAGRLADRAFDIAEHQQQLRRTVAVARHAAELSGELDTYRTELDTDADFKTRADRFNQRARELMDKRAEGMSDIERAAFLARVEPVASSMEMSVRHRAAKDEIDDSRVRLMQSNDDLLTRASTARSDVERQGYLDQVKANIEDAQKAGMLTPAQYRDMQRSTLSKFDEAQAMGLVRTRGGAAIAILNDPKNFPNMDPARREFWKWQAQAKADAQGAEARANARFDAQDLQISLQQGILPADYEPRLKAIEATQPRLAARIRDQKQALDLIEGTARLPLAQQKTRLDELAAKESGTGLDRHERIEYLALSKIYRAAIAGFEQDPFLQSVKSSPAIAELLDQVRDRPEARLAAGDAALELQAQNGVPEFRRAVMGKPEIKRLVDELHGLSGPQLVDRLRALRVSWKHLWPVVARQLREEGKLEGKVPGVETLLELPETPAGLAAAANLAEAAKLDDAKLKTLVPKDADLSAIRSRVEEHLAPFRLSLTSAGGGGSAIARYVEDTTKLAVRFHASGMSVSEATERAARQLVLDHYDFVPGGRGAQVRVPKILDQRAVDLEAVRHNLEMARRAVGDLTDSLVVPPNPLPTADAVKDRAAFQKRLQAYGIWQTTPDGRAAMLMYEANGRLHPVLRSRGAGPERREVPYVVPFDAPKARRVEGWEAFDPGTGMPTRSGR